MQGTVLTDRFLAVELARSQEGLLILAARMACCVARCIRTYIPSSSHCVSVAQHA